VGQLQMVYNYKPSQFFHKYHDVAKTPLYPFGYGLSFTKFLFGKPSVLGTLNTANDQIQVTVDVTNTGKIAGEEVVQLYIRDNFSSVTRPVKELKGYKRIALNAGETKTVTLTLNTESFAFYDINFNYGIEAGDFTLLVGNSSDDKALQSVNFNVPNSIKLNK
jgi:beta-glucosidase